MTKAEAENGTKQRFGVSVYLKCIALILFTTLPVTGILLLQNIRTTETLAKDGVRELGYEVTTLVARNTAGAVRFGLPDPISESLNNAISNSNGSALFGMAVSANGTIIVENGEVPDSLRQDLLVIAEAAMATGQAEITGDGFIVAAPARANSTETPAGAIVMVWTPDVLVANIASEKTRAVVVAGGSLGVMLLFGGALLWHIVSKPLTRVRASVEAVEGGDYSSEVPYAKRGDEIGKVAQSLNILRETLAASEETNRDAIMKGGGFDGSSAAMVLTDAEMNIVSMNKAFTALADKRGAELKQAAPNFDLDKMIGMNMDAFHRSPSTNRNTLNSVSFPHKTAIQIDQTTLGLTISDIQGENGEIVGYVLEWNDETIAQKNSAILSALEASQVQVDFLADGTITSTNVRFDELVGSSGATSFETLVEPVEEDHSVILADLGSGRAWFGKVQMKKATNGHTVLEASICPILSSKNDVLGFVLLGNDITQAEENAKLAEAERARMQEDQAMVVEGLRVGLAGLSKGKVNNRINDPFPSEYEGLRKDFNEAVSQLDEAMVAVVQNATSIRSEANEITSAADDLSRRTEHQAATLEETAAALTEITRSVGSASKGADEANRVVSDARKNAEESGGVVREAVEAMGEIENSSDQISKIISVIDDIAFQTNLLALNAGVEAARAGEAGRGFAVVASEVRALAQRSSDAAREINDLISRSGSQVKRGVALVGNAGDALERIVSSVSGIAEHVSAIAASSSEQSAALDEINSAMSQLDQVTQQNAAMFEETTAASHALTSEAETLFKTMGRFTTSAKTLPPLAPKVPVESPPTKSKMESQTQTTSVVPPSSNAVAEVGQPAGTTSTALATQFDDDDWEDF
ncbi:MAG: HAMP domain-containing methyl-accepting chemotaxis protein [Pseudomonadota bacterium]